MKYMDFYRTLVLQSDGGSGGGGGGSDCPFLPPASEGYTEYKDALQKEYVYNIISQAGSYVGTDAAYEQGISFELANAIADSISVNDKLLFTGEAGEHRDYNPDTGDEIVTPAGVYALWGKLTFKEEPYEEEPREYTYVTMTVDGVVLRPFYSDGYSMPISSNGYRDVYGANAVTVNVAGDPYALAPADSAYVVTTSNNITYTNLKNYWTNKNTTVKYRVRKNASVVVGGKVAIKYSNTWCMWGVVGSVTSVNTSYDDITLSEYHGFAYQNNNRSGETHVTKNGTYSNAKNMQLDVNVAGSGSIDAKALIENTITSINDDTLTLIRQSAFRVCTHLTSARFGSVKEVQAYAFSGDNALTTLDFALSSGSGNRSLAPYVCGDCSALTAVILRSSRLWYAAAHMFDNTPIASGTGYIYVPSALLASYKTASNWSTYSAQFRALEDYTVDGTTTGDLDPTKI